MHFLFPHSGLWIVVVDARCNSIPRRLLSTKMQKVSTLRTRLALTIATHRRRPRREMKRKRKEIENLLLFARHGKQITLLFIVIVVQSMSTNKHVPTRSDT